MRQDCDICGEFAECKLGICAQCLLEGYQDETSKEGEGKEEEAEEA